MAKQGRPTKYVKIYDEQVFKLCLLGADDKQIADFFEVDLATINRWKKSHITFCESIKAGKVQADTDVAMTLYKRAMGYSHPDEEIKVVSDGGGMGSSIERVPVTKVYPPDVTAAIFWLKNRQPRQWRDKQEVQLTTFVHTTTDLTADEIKAYNKALEDEY